MDLHEMQLGIGHMVWHRTQGNLNTNHGCRYLNTRVEPQKESRRIHLDHYHKQPLDRHRQAQRILLAQHNWGRNKPNLVTGHAELWSKHH